jgi:hypothetical protein
VRVTFGVAISTSKNPMATLEENLLRFSDFDFMLIRTYAKLSQQGMAMQAVSIVRQGAIRNTQHDVVVHHISL